MLRWKFAMERRWLIRLPTNPFGLFVCTLLSLLVGFVFATEYLLKLRKNNVIERCTIAHND